MPAQRLELPPPPPLLPMAQVRCDVGPVTSLGAAPLGERRYVQLLGGEVVGPELRGRIVEGGVDWQVARSDGALEIAAHYVVDAGSAGSPALVEVQSNGLRHASPEVMARLAAGEDVPRDAYFFRTLMRFTTGHADWRHLNRVMAIAVGQRRARQVVLDVYRLA